MFGCYGDDTQEEEDEGFRDGAEHLDHMSDGCTGTLGNVLLHIVLHGESTGYDAAGAHRHRGHCGAFLLQLNRLLFRYLMQLVKILMFAHAMMDEMAKSSATR